MQIEIKKISPDEAEEKIDINIKTWYTTYKGILPVEVIDKCQAKTKERIEKEKEAIKEKNNIYGMYVDNKLVGYASYGAARDEKYKGSGEIISCYILEEYQHHHLGRKVVIKILEDLIEEGYQTMITRCLVGNPSNRFHASIGGKLVGQGTINLQGDEFAENIYYHKDLKKSLKLNQVKEKGIIKEEENRLVYLLDEEEIGEVEYKIIGDKTVDIYHTYVDPDYQGLQIASILMTELFKKLQKENLKVIASCSYADHWLKKHPEYRNN